MEKPAQPSDALKGLGIFEKIYARGEPNMELPPIIVPATVPTEQPQFARYESLPKTLGRERDWLLGIAVVGTLFAASRIPDIVARTTQQIRSVSQRG